MNGRVLVLNSTYEPINVCSVRRAIVMVLKGVARTEERTANDLRTTRKTFPAPSVIRLMDYVHIPFERKSLSRKNILLRDHNTCQYCGQIFNPADLTLDHVFPRSRGGPSNWDNLVACCNKRENDEDGDDSSGAGVCAGFFKRAFWMLRRTKLTSEDARRQTLAPMASSV